jgi:hypothetical protein
MVDRAVLVMHGVTNPEPMVTALSDYLGLDVACITTKEALTQFARAAGHGQATRANVVAAMLEDALLLDPVPGWYKGADGGRQRHGLYGLRDVLFSIAKADGVDAWSRSRLWYEFLAWQKGVGLPGGADLSAFDPSAIDPRLAPVSIWADWAQRQVAALTDEISRVLVAGLVGGDLLLLVDDDLQWACQHALREKTQAAGVAIVPMTPDQIVRQIAREPGKSSAPAVPRLAVRLIESGEPAPLAITLPHLVGQPPQSVSIVLEGRIAGQQNFELELLRAEGAMSAGVLRRLRFLARLPMLDVPRLRLHIDTRSGSALRCVLKDERNGELLRLVDSMVPCEDGSMLSGPEMLSGIVPAAT